MRFGLDNQKIEQIITVLRKSKTVKKVVIFGSRARGDYQYNSDVDIAVYTDGETAPGLLSDIDEAIGIYKVDVIMMNKLPNGALRSNIENDGIEIYRRAEQDHIYTHKDLELFPENEIWELVEGVPYLMARPSAQHERIATELTRQFANYLLNKPCEVFTAPFGVYLPDTKNKNNFVSPDLMVVCQKFEGPKFYGVPDLIIEIISPSNDPRELQKKFKLYQTLEVKEYWLIYPETETVSIFRLNQNKKYELTDSYDTEDEDSNSQIKVGIFENLWIDFKLVLK